MSDSISGVVASNLFLGIFIGGAVSQVLGVVRLLQILLLQAVIQVSYPAHVNYFYKLVVNLADMDLLNGPIWYEIVFDFKRTSPYNRQYEQFAITDLNFFNNTGSMLLIFLGMVINCLFWKAVKKISIKCYRLRRCRKIGIYSS